MYYCEMAYQWEEKHIDFPKVEVGGSLMSCLSSCQTRDETIQNVQWGN